MIRFKDSKAQLDDLLARMVESVQLDETRKKKMESSYKTIENLLKEDILFFKNNDFELYPQGSVKIETTVKPIANNEFDLDVVVHLKIDWTKFKPNKIYNELKRVLEASGNHKDLIELKNRCIRLNYSGDYHMDILPGCQEYSHDNNKLRIPDKEQGDWASSNPRGYSEWFLSRANMVKLTLLEKAYSLEKLPGDDFSKKKPLQRAVQLIKVYRDKYFEKKQDKATSSIILTTISGQFYNGEDSIFDTIDSIINRIKIEISNREWNKQRLVILNPVNNEEDFTDKWENEPELYENFKLFIRHLDEQWKKLKFENGVNENSQIMKGLFGESIYQKGFTSQEEFFERTLAKENDEFSGLRKLAQPATPTHKPWLY